MIGPNDGILSDIFYISKAIFGALLQRAAEHHNSITNVDDACKQYGIDQATFSHLVREEYDSDISALISDYITRCIDAYNQHLLQYGHRPDYRFTPQSDINIYIYIYINMYRHVVKEDFACFSAFLGTFKKGPN